MEHRFSIFSQNLDRTALTAFFLGAIVPLLALCIILERFVLPVIEDSLVRAGLIAGVASITILSLASFLTLRRTTRTSLSRMDRDNRHLTALLDAAGNLASTQHIGHAAEVAVKNGILLSDADACFVFSKSDSDAEFACLSAAGVEPEKLEERVRDQLISLVDLVVSEGRPGSRAADENCNALVAVPIPGETTPIGAIVIVSKSNVKQVGLEDLNALSTLGSLTSVAMSNGDLKDSQRNFFTHVTEMLVSAMDSHLGYHTGHSNRTARLANQIGRGIGLDDHRMGRLHFASLLHDIGLLKLNRKLQIDPRTGRQHAALGAKMLARIRLWQDLAPIILHHHERWDGSGYPDAIAGESIPLESRIIAVCDVFDTITNPTSYKESRPFAEGVQEIEACSGRQFDPEVVRVFLSLVSDGEIVPEKG